MKNIWKRTLLFSVVAGSAALLGCTPDEELNLAGYPEITPGVVIADAKGSAMVTLAGKYDGSGTLMLDGLPSRTYIVTLPTPSPEDVTLYFEPIIVNIPAEMVTISEQEVVIPAGFVSTRVTVGLTGDDFSFAQPDYTAKTYELGLRVSDAKGQHINFAQPDAKVIIEKEAYVANCSLVGAEGNQMTFTRSYLAGEILNEEGMAYTFKARLDKPAKSDVKITFTTSGLADQFVKDVVVTPAELTIPAGQLESTEEAVWTLTDDFLLTTDDVEAHKVLLASVTTSDDPTVRAADGSSVLTFNVIKNLEAVVLVSAIGSDWTKFDRTGWTADGGGNYTYGKPSDVIDGNLRNDIDGNEFWVSIDLKEVKTIAGFTTLFYGTSHTPKRVAIYISDDGVTWKGTGTQTPPENVYLQYYKMLGEISTRYLKFEIVESYNDRGTWLTEIEIYGYTN